MSENLKNLAAQKALDFVKNNMVIGLGTGSTADLFTIALAEKTKSENLNISTVSSSYSTTILAEKNGLDIIHLERCPGIDVYIDGADEVDPEKNLIKGQGGAMVQEKILAHFAKKFIVVVDDSKLVTRLGSKFPVPVEIIPMALPLVINEIKGLNGTAVIRQAVKKSGPVITDQGNFILDVTFPSDVDLKVMDPLLNNIPGVLGHGIFINTADEVISAGSDGVRLV